MINPGDNVVNVEGELVLPITATYIDEGEISALLLRAGVSRRRQVSPVGRVHVSTGTVQARAPLVFGEVMVIGQGGRLCLRGQ